MGIIKKIFGWAFLFFGSICLVHAFLNAPYSKGEVAVGYIIGGLFFASISFYFGAKWVKKT